MSPKPMSHEPMPPDIDYDDLPDDLRQLGFDLTRQAQSLASAYPAGLRDSAAEHPREKPRRLAGLGKMVPLVSVGIALTGLIAVMAIGFPGFPATEILGDAHLALEQSSAAESGNRELANTEPATTSSPTADNQAPDPMPTRLFPVGIGLPVDGTRPNSPPDFTSPEWEAILDLMPAEDWEGIELSL